MKFLPSARLLFWLCVFSWLILYQVCRLYSTCMFMSQTKHCSPFTVSYTIPNDLNSGSEFHFMFPVIRVNKPNNNWCYWRQRISFLCSSLCPALRLCSSTRIQAVHTIHNIFAFVVPSFKWTSATFKFSLSLTRIEASIRTSKSYHAHSTQA